MCTQEIVLNNRDGLHSSAALRFLQETRQFKCRILVQKENCIVDARSLLGLLSLSVEKGTCVTLIADGCDEEVAINTLTNFLISLNVPQN